MHLSLRSVPSNLKLSLAKKKKKILSFLFFFLRILLLVRIQTQHFFLPSKIKACLSKLSRVNVFVEKGV